jgi:5-formyltetrahydrofolate cyclo-ligase
MDVGIHKAKQELRSKIHAAREKMPLEKRRLDSQKLCLKLKEQFLFQSATSILFFAPMPKEPDMWTLLEGALAEGKTVALPHFDKTNRCYVPRRVQNLRNEIATGRFGIREPVAGCPEMLLADFDLVLVPGVAFDLRGHRLGRGKGYYDRWLADYAGTKIGVAFDEQVIETVPAGKQDVRMDFILTPMRCAKCDE